MNIEKGGNLDREKLLNEKEILDLVNKRLEIWNSVIDDSLVSDFTKNQIKEDLSKFRENLKPNMLYKDLSDVFYYSISRILNISNKDENKEGAKDLFDNLRDDLWAFFEEIKYSL